MGRSVYRVGTMGRGLAAVAVLVSVTALDLVVDPTDVVETGWVCFDVIQAPDGTPRDGFGSGVAWVDDRLLIGAPYDDRVTVDAGVVHVYDVTAGEIVAQWAPPALPPSARFGGTLVATGGDVIVGAPFAAHPQVMPGPVDWHVFVVDAGTGAVRHHFTGDRAGTWHEGPIAVAADGGRLVLGVPDAVAADKPGATGTVQVHEISDGRLLSSWWGTSPPGERPSFGAAVAVAGDRVFVGDSFRGEADSGAVEAFRIGNERPQMRMEYPGPAAPYYFGGGLATDGERLAVALTGFREVRIFPLDASEADAAAPVVATTGADSAPEWGTTMKFTPRGLFLAGGAPGPWSDWLSSGVRDHVALLDPDTGALQSRAEFHPGDARTGFGYSFDLGPQGVLAVGAPRLASESGLGGAVFLLRETMEGERPVPCTVQPLLSEDACEDSEDRDGDGLLDAEETEMGLDPCVIDSDGDHLGDGLEVLVYGSDPHVPDTDGDGLPDRVEVYEAHTDPVLFDTDGDGFGDGCERRARSDPNDPLVRPAADQVAVDCFPPVLRDFVAPHALAGVST